MADTWTYTVPAEKWEKMPDDHKDKWSPSEDGTTYSWEGPEMASAIRGKTEARKAAEAAEAKAAEAQKAREDGEARLSRLASLAGASDANKLEEALTALADERRAKETEAQRRSRELRELTEDQKRQRQELAAAKEELAESKRQLLSLHARDTAFSALQQAGCFAPDQAVYGFLGQYPASQTPDNNGAMAYGGLELQEAIEAWMKQTSVRQLYFDQGGGDNEALPPGRRVRTARASPGGWRLVD